MARKKTIADAKCPAYGGETELKHIRKARQTILRFLAKAGAPAKASDRDEVSIRTFAELQELDIPEGVEEKKWLMDLYHSGTSDIIKKEDYAFYSSKVWRELRAWALDFFGRKCMKCGDDTLEDTDLHIDHIKPKAKYPELALDKKNVQVLCWLCNRTKSDRGEEDFRSLPVGFETTPVTGDFEGFETSYVLDDGKYKKKEDGGPQSWSPTSEKHSKELLIEHFIEDSLEKA